MPIKWYYNKIKNKRLVFVSIAGVILVMLLFGIGCYSLLDTEYLFGWGRFKLFPEEIRQKHAATIEKVDTLIRKENKDNIASRSENFNLELYLKLIEIGVYPYLKEDEPLRMDVQLLMEDVRNYIK